MITEGIVAGICVIGIIAFVIYKKSKSKSLQDIYDEMDKKKEDEK